MMMRTLLFLLAYLVGRCTGSSCGTSQHLQVRYKNWYGPIAVLTYDSDRTNGGASELSYELEFPASSGPYNLLIYSGDDYFQVNQYLTCQENEGFLTSGSYSIQLTAEGISPPCQEVKGQNDTATLRCSGKYALPCVKCSRKPYPKWYVAISNCDKEVAMSDIDMKYSITTKGMLVCTDDNGGSLLRGGVFSMVLAFGVCMWNFW